MRQHRGVIVALIPCKACNRPISPQARSCPNCGHPVNPAESTSSPVATNTKVRSTPIALTIVVLGLIIVGIAKCSNDSNSVATSNAAPAQQAQPAAKPTPQAAVERGRNMLKILSMANSPWPTAAWLQQTLDALHAVPASAPEYAAATNILADYAAHGEDWKKAHDVAAAKQETAHQQAKKAAQEVLRIAYRRQLEDLMLSKGLNVDVTLAGKQNDRLTIKYVLASKVTAYQFSHSEFPNQWSDMGFSKVILTDGYNESYTWDFTAK